ncbi:MAG: aminotransferase class IV [Candidatus Neomarinimicrobiota bacterium]
MINVLINGSWNKFKKNQLQPGSKEFYFESGIYETLRTKNHKPVFLTAHLNRLFESVKTLHLKTEFQRLDIEKMITKVIKSSANPDQRTRILLLPENVVVYTTPLIINPKIYNGVSTITISAMRDNPHIKSTKYEVCLNAYEVAQNYNCFDAIFIDKYALILEGSKSNVFWIKEKKLFTRQKNVLPGITREMIIKKSPYPVHFGKLNTLHLNDLDELFLTNSSSGIIPVTRINKLQIRDGLPGPITKHLLNIYDTWF